MNIKEKGEKIIENIQQKTVAERKKMQYFLVSVTFVLILIIVFVLSKIQTIFEKTEPIKDSQGLIDRIKNSYQKESSQIESTYQEMGEIKKGILESIKEKGEDIKTAEEKKLENNNLENEGQKE